MVGQDVDDSVRCGLIADRIRAVLVHGAQIDSSSPGLCPGQEFLR